MTLQVAIPPEPHPHEFTRDRERRIVLGRSASADVRVGHQRVHGRLTVSKEHAAVVWDGLRWATTNISERPGLLHVYEPGYEEEPIEPGRTWTPSRHRWSYAFGVAGHRFDVVCATEDHQALSRGPAADPVPGADPVGGEDEPTASLEAFAPVTFTPLERETLLAYYAPFAALPRPRVLEPASHDAAVVGSARSRDSMRKALERINEKIARVPGAPPVATGRNVSAEIGRWLARQGMLDP